MSLSKTNLAAKPTKTLILTAGLLLLFFITNIFFFSLTSRPIFAQAEEDTCALDPIEYYNLYPIIYEADRFGGDPVTKLVQSLTHEQGYEVHCASQQGQITQKLINENWAEYFYENYGGTIIFDDCGAYGLSAEGSRVPVYRSDECTEFTHKASSYEAFFGSLVPEKSPLFFREQGEELDSADPLNSGVANHLLSKTQQCEIKFNNLETIAFYCRELAEMTHQDWCYLDTPIKNSDYSRLQLYWELYDLIEDYKHKDPTGEGLDCSDITGAWSTLVKDRPQAIEDTELTEEKFYEIQTALDNTSFNIENLYRTAFLVVAFGQDPPQTNADLYEDPNLTQNEHATLLFIFKVPDFLANQSRFKDASEVLRLSLTTKEQQDEHKQQAAERRDGLYRQAKARSEGTRFLPGDPIYCPTRPECQPQEGVVEEILAKETLSGQDLPNIVAAGNTIIRNALIDIINGHHTNDSCICCEEMPFEQAGDISTPAKLEITDQAQFFGEDPNLYYPDPEKTAGVETNFNWRFEASDYESYQQNLQFREESGLPSRAWIVLPYGIEQEQVLEAMQQRFFTLEQQQILEEENIVVDSRIEGRLPEYFTFDADYGMFFGEAGCSSQEMYSFEDYKSDECKEVEICQTLPYGQEWCYIEIQCPQREFGKGIVEEKKPPLIFGSLVGWGLRKVQETLHRSTTEIYNYFTSCERVEDMFLGRCGIDDEYGPPDGQPYAGRAPGEDWTYGSCTPITDDNNPCSISNLKEKLATYIQERGSSPISDNELTKRATQASIICNAESGGNPDAANTGCLTGNTVDYSIGLFQINLLAHDCPEYFTYTWNPPWCDIVAPYTQEDVEACAEPLFNPDYNIKRAFDISGAGSNWNPWSTAQPYACGPVIYSL